MKKLLTPLFSLLVLALRAQVASPDLKCLFVNPGPTGDVLLTWVIPPDPNNQFVAYHIFTNPTQGPGFSPIASINTYNTTTFTHVGAGANAAPVYYYIVTEYNNNGNFFSTPLDTFSTIYLNITPTSGFTATLNYNEIHTPLPVSNAATYDVFSDYPVTNTLETTTGQLTYKDTVVVCGDTVRYFVENHDNTGCVSRSNVNKNYYKDITNPVVPVVDSVSVDAAGNAEIGWDPSSDGDVVAYVIYQYYSGSWHPVDTVYGHNNTTYTYANSTADANSETYSVAAIDSCGNIGPYQVPGQNTIFAQAQLDKCMRTVTLTWNGYVNWPSPPTGYTIFASFNGGPFNAIGSVGGGVNTFVHTGVVNGNWCYIIRAYGPNGKTSSSQKLCITATVAVLPTFTYVTTATVIDPSQVQVNTYVDLAASVQSYRLERSDASTGPYTPITSVPYSGSPMITFLDNTASTTTQPYFYQVVSVDSCGHDAQVSAYSETIHLTATANPDRTNTLEWNNYAGWLGGVGSYDIYRSIDGSPFTMVGSVNFPTTTYVDDVDPYYSSNGHFIYYVQAHEAVMNVYNFQESSNSNPADCYQESKFFVPNAFAPHGVNTIFLPIGAYYDKTEYSLSIFDRWGEKLFETDDYTKGWDGTYNGSACEQGVYVYLVRYKTSIGKMEEQAGTVTKLGK